MPRQLERMERQTLLKVEAMKQSHNEELGQLAEKMEKEALLRLNQESRKALEENTMLLRQVSIQFHRSTRDFSLFNKPCNSLVFL